MTPPRALWVPFEFGRPFGNPGEADFQRRVVVDALQLLERPSGPVLHDFPDEAPPTQTEGTEWVCPVSFAKEKVELSAPAAVAAELTDEIARFNPWYDRAVNERGRTQVGTSNLSMEDIVAAIAAMFSDERPASPIEGSTWSASLKLMTEDLKAFYLEAMLAQPGGRPGPELEDWFWDKTAAGRTLLELQERCVRSDDPDLQFFGELLLVPARQAERRASSA